MQRYGYKSTLSSDKVREKFKQRYGSQYPSQRHRTAEQIAITADKQSFETYLRSFDNPPTTTMLSENLTLCMSRIGIYLHKYELWHLVDRFLSTYEREVHDLFPTDHVNSHQVVDGMVPDLYYPEHKLAIEINGNYWHDEEYKPKDYHVKRTVACEAAGIRLIQIWEYELIFRRKQIVAMLSNIFNPSKPIYARDCQVKNISAASYRRFCKEHHIQGYSSASVKVGLIYNDVLVAVMGFGKPRFSKNHQWEVVRLCSSVRIIGGANRMFAYFVRKHQPESIVSYCDLSKFTGKTYEKLGFRLSHVSSPNFVWIRGLEVRSRYACQRHKLEAEGKSASAIMRQQGFSKLYDCGNKVFEWLK